MIYFITFLFGTLFGSFFYTLSVRFIDGTFSVKKYKALLDYSRCPSCGKRIMPLYLIPLAGYLISKGRCAECGSKISVLYPLMEILFGILALLVRAKFGINIYSLMIFLILSLSISVSIIDIKLFKIPDSLIIVFFILSIYPVLLTDSMLDNLYGFLLMGGFFIVALLIFPGSFGGGDVKFASVVGILIGFELSVVALETALVAGSIIGVFYAIKLKKGFKIKMPFAPFIAGGMFVSLFYGREILFIYYRMFFE